MSEVETIDKAAQKTKLNFVESWLPGLATKRLALIERKHQLAVAETQDRFFEEIAAIEANNFRKGSNLTPVQEETLKASLQEGGSGGMIQSNPWQFDLATLTIDQAWRQGFPFADPGIVDDTYIAHNDPFREQILKLCRTLYTNHPNAKGMVNTALAFLCGGSAWTIQPSPKIPEYLDNTIRPVQEHSRGWTKDFWKKYEDAQHELREKDTKEERMRFYHSFAEAFGLQEDGIDHVGLEPDPINLLLPSPIYSDYNYADLPEVLDVDLARELRRGWKKYCKKGGIHPQLSWIKFWREAVRRKIRDGEAMIYCSVDPGTHSLAPRFIDPLDVKCPIAMRTMRVATDGKLIPTQDTAGIRVDPLDPCKVLGYWWHQPGEQNPVLIPGHLVMHIKHAVDADTRRGLPAIYCVRHYLKHFDTWIMQALKHHKIQTMVAILRQWKDTTPQAIRDFVGKQAVIQRQYSTPAGNTRNWQTFETLPVVDVNGQQEIKYTTPDSNFADSEILARRIILCMAVGMSMSEAMISADGSQGNYSSTRITQLIPLKCFEAEQAEWSDECIELYTRWESQEVAVGHVKQLKTIEDDSQLDCDVTPPRLPNFEAEMVIQYAMAAQQSGATSMRRYREMIGENNDQQKQQILEEELEKAERTAMMPMAPQQFDDQGNPINLSGEDSRGVEHDPNSGKFAPNAEKLPLETQRAAKLAASMKSNGNGYEPDGRDGSGR